MKCPLCKGEILDGVTNLTFEKETEHILVVSGVPARVCQQCGETFIDIETVKKVEFLVDSAEKDGITFGFVKYKEVA